MCGVLCGLDNLEDIVDYGKNKLEFLSTNFNIKKIPSNATLSRILNMINADEVSNKIIEIMVENIGELGEIIAVDGKAIRRTSKKRCSTFSTSNFNCLLHRKWCNFRA